MTTIPVGFIGLGSQGGPMARRIADAGFALTLWARRPETLETFADTAATTASSPAELAQRSGIVCICVTGDADVEEVLHGSSGVLAGLSSGATLVIHSTIHPQTCVQVSQIAAGLGVGLVDAPVSGGGLAASQGRLLVLAGGHASDLERVRPVLATFGDPILHLGAVGAGQTAKLINNLVFTAQLALSIEVFSFVAELGVDRESMAKVLESGSGGSRATSIVSGAAFDLKSLGHAAGALLQKDVALIADVAERSNVGLPTSILGLAQTSLAAMNPPEATIT